MMSQELHFQRLEENNNSFVTRDIYSVLNIKSKDHGIINKMQQKMIFSATYAQTRQMQCSVITSVLSVTITFANRALPTKTMQSLKWQKIQSCLQHLFNKLCESLILDLNSEALIIMMIFNLKTPYKELSEKKNGFKISFLIQEYKKSNFSNTNRNFLKTAE